MIEPATPGVAAVALIAGALERIEEKAVDESANST